ncbi:xanthine dehydrogenase family protein subunit M [Egibacter rhizosphaerae]|uniref:Xanthine dehydrogenase family protein subunit M n=1 Tax=Egibacter rhizosphaerae TaxID=1670831 RepID=A0A411YCX3_9ACTN|nr:FAD binding domain-containing protein [Egibacter rhizosphaerae]QBI19093.1 xanthine dehydrogenase family protein subunit M [Egibacter rhizosphaerae]
MKPPPFEYHAPDTVAEAVRRLGEGGKVLAGGQSLIPLLNMRLTAPRALVDVTGIEELRAVEVSSDTVRVGAAVRHRDLERHREAGEANPLLPQALGYVAHEVIRNRGTVVGSLAHADPAGELTAVLALCDGVVELARAGDGGEVVTRRVSASDFFLGPLEADIAPGELVTHAEFAALPATTGSAFVERARRHGDYALCGIAATVDAPDGEVAAARIATISVHPTPLVLDVGDAAAGRSLEPATAPEAWSAAGERVAAACEPEADLHAPAEYRRHLASVLTARALAQASAHARDRVPAAA